MQYKSVLAPAVLGLLGSLAFAAGASAQPVSKPDHFLGACLIGTLCPEPCHGTPDNALTLCPAPAHVTAIRAGRLFDSNSGTLLTNQVILLTGERITAVGPASSVAIPAGAVVIDLSRETVLPGLIDAHTHMFNNAKPGLSRDAELLIGLQNTQADLRAGFTTIRDMSTHGNGHADVDIRNAINAGYIEGPRQLVSTEGIVWGGPPGTAGKPVNPLASIVIHSAEEGRAAVDTQVKEGADWIKLFPTGGYQFLPGGVFKVEVTYPLPVLQATVDEAHKMGKKVGCHVYGGEGQKNAVVAGCDTVEHMFEGNQELFTQMAAKGQYYDPTFVRYLIEQMNQYEQLRPLFEKSVQMAAKTPGLKIMYGTGVDGTTYTHGSQAMDFIELVKLGGLTPARTLQAATIVNAQAFGLFNQIGSVEKGKFADIVAVPGNPLADISTMSHINFVMKGGKVIRDDTARRVAAR